MTRTRSAIIILCVLLLSVPVSVATTLLLLPLWSWIEAHWGLESLGHSGPADWCYFAIYATTAVSIAIVSNEIRARLFLATRDDRVVFPEHKAPALAE
ncbi:MAG: hypothetical protein ABL934_00925 [Lysobacteraceae bacterium]